MARPSITVIIPVYNCASFVEECVKSCLNQTLTNIEVVCVDDGSTDDSLTKLQDMAAGEKRLTVIHQSNGGAASARNNALDNACGEYVFFIDGDDYIPEETALERLYHAACTNNVLIAGGSMGIDHDGNGLDFEWMHGAKLDSFFEEAVVSYADYQYDYDFTRFIYSLDMLNDNKIRFPLLSQFEDPVFHVQAMLTAEKFATIPDAVYAYRYGHQHRTWGSQAVLDRLAGIATLLTLSSEARLPKLHQNVLHQFDTETTYVFLDHVGNPCVMSELFKTNSLIDCDLLQSINPSFPDAYLVEPIRIILDEWQWYRHLRETKPGRLYRRVSKLLRR